MAKINIKLTNTKIQELHREKRIKDETFSCGDNLYIVFTKTGKAIFRYRVAVDNNRSWYVLGNFPEMKLQDAKIKAIEVKKQVANGVNPAQAKKDAKNKRMTLSEFTELYIKERLPIVRKNNKNTDKHVVMIKNQILSVLGKYYVDQITDDKIRQLIEKKTSQGTHGMAYHMVATLKVILNYALERGLIEKNPVMTKKYYNIDTNNYRERALSEDEIQQLLQLIYGKSIINIKYAIAIHLLLMLLMRKTELLHAKWEQVDFKQETFLITRDCKTGKELTIGLPRQAMQLFKVLKQWSYDSEFIFQGIDKNKPVNENTMNKNVNYVRAIMFGSDEKKYFSVHDLRRTARTQLGVKLKCPSDYIEEALNHAKPEMIRRYHIGDYFDERKEMLQKWANVLDGWIGEELLPYDKLLSQEQD